MWKQYRDTNYEVSDDGRVRNKKTKKEIKQSNKEKREHSYKKVSLHIDGKDRAYSVHRMVLEAFTYRDDSKEVNHKNLMPDDNRLSNLEYVTREENLEHAFRNSKKIVQRKPVVGVKIGTKEVTGFRSLYMAGKYIGGKYIGGKGIEEKKITHYSSAIKNAIIGKINSVGGYYWWFKENFNFKDIDSMIESKKKPEKYTEEQKALMEKNKLNTSIINKRMKTYGLSLDEALKYKKGHRFAEPIEVKPNPNSKCMQGIGKRFGNLEVLEVIRVKGKKPLYKCKCDCGGIFTTQYTNVLIGKTKGCGCGLAN